MNIMFSVTVIIYVIEKKDILEVNYTYSLKNRYN